MNARKDACLEKEHEKEREKVRKRGEVQEVEKRRQGEGRNGTK